MSTKPHDLKPEEEDKSCWDQCRASVVGFLPKCFTAFASCVLKPIVVPVLIILACIILAVLAAGVSQGSLETQLHEIWIPTEARIQGERGFYVDHFGGASYLEFVIITDANGSETVNTVSKLNALAYVTSGLEDQTDQCEDEIVVNSREPKFEAVTTNNGSQTFHLSDFCKKTQVPVSLSPCTTCTEAGATRYDYLHKGLPIAWGYAALARCNWANRGSVGVAMPPHLQAAGIHAQFQQQMSDWSLEPTWGIDRFPCSGASILKAFKEGNIGYPACLRLLEKDRSNFVTLLGPAGAAAGVFGTADANYWFSAATGCLDGTPTVGTSVKAQFIQDLQVASGCMQGAPTCHSSATASGYATAWVSLVHIYRTSFYGMGFRHKMSYNSLAAGSTDDGAAAIASFLSTAIANNEMAATECASTPFSWEGTVRGYFPCIMSELVLPLPEELMLSSDRGTAANGDYTRFGAFRSSLTISAIDAPNHIADLAKKGVATSQEREDLLEKWENTVYAYLYPFWKGSDSNFQTGGVYADSTINFFLTKQSLVDQLRETGEFENSLMLILIGFGLLIAFSMAWYCSCHAKLKYCSLVVLSGIMCVGLGVLGGYGFLGWLDWKYSVSSPVVALVGLGLGCDDMFIILNAYFSNVGYGMATEDVILQTLLQSGPSVVVTTLSNIVGFAIASVMDIPAVRTFCVQMAMTCFLILLAMVMILMPVLVLHAKAVNDENEETDKAARQPGADMSIELPVTRNANPGVHEDGVEHNLVGLSQKFVTQYYAPALNICGVKMVIVSVWLTVTMLGIWGATEIDLGLSIKDVSKEGSYQYDFSKQNDNFPGYTASVVSRQTSWTASSQKSSLNQDIALQASEWVSSTNKMWTIAWLGNRSSSLLGYSATMAVTTDANTPNAATGENLYVKGADGYSLFDKWLQVAGTTSSNFFVCHTTQTSGIDCQCTDATFPDRRIVASSHPFTLRGLVDVDDFVNMIDDTRKICDESNGDGNDSFVYGTAYLYWEQYLGIEKRLYTLCAICIAGIVVTTMLVEFSIQVAALMLLLLISYTIETIGAITLLGLKLNAFSLVNCVVSIGFAVEYMVHMTHAFMIATGSHEERVAKALSAVGAATFAGALTAFLAILPLRFSSVPLFQDYFFSVFAVASAIGCFNGLAVWPVILSLFGPNSSTPIVEDPIVEDPIVEDPIVENPVVKEEPISTIPKEEQQM